MCGIFKGIFGGGDKAKAILPPPPPLELQKPKKTQAGRKAISSESNAAIPKRSGNAGFNSFVTSLLSESGFKGKTLLGGG